MTRGYFLRVWLFCIGSMRAWQTFLALLFLVFAATIGYCADAAAQVEQSAGTASQAATGHGEHGGGEHHGLTPDAPVFNLGPLQFTNSMVVTWSVALLLIIVAQVAMRNVQLVPQGMQNFIEWLVEGMYNFFGDILGADLVKKSFWFFCTLFVFILFTNWFGLIPGVGTVGHQVTMSDGSHLFKPFLRGGNADLNMTLAMSLVYCVLWLFWSLQALGPGGMARHIFWGGGGQGFMGLFMIVIFFVVGLIEVVSIAFRPVSLSFRLYGNIFAGENILEAMMVLVPWLGWIIPLPFYFLELLVGLVQALVFALLTAVFTALMAGHHEEGHGHDKDKHGAHAH